MRTTFQVQEPGQAAHPGMSDQARQALRDQIRQQVQQQVREQVRAAQEQAAVAREQASIAREQARIAREQARTVHEQRTTSAHTVVIDGHDMPRIPPEAVEASITFFVIVAALVLGLPLLRAFGRRLARPAELRAPDDPEVTARLTRIEHAVDAVALEVERIAESQRFTTGLLRSGRSR